MSLCARVDVFIELSNGPVKREIRSLLHWKQVLRTNAALSAKQLSAQVLCTSAAQKKACCTGSKCCAQMLHQVQSDCRHKCCAQVLRSCANMYCLPLCAHYHETRTKRTSYVCAHRTLQRVPLNTRYTFKQPIMFNGVGICACADVAATAQGALRMFARIERFNEYL